MGTLFLFILITSFSTSIGNQCLIDGVNSWFLPYETNILDTFRGNVVDLSTSNIQGILSYSFFEGLNSGPYFNVILEDSRFLIETTDAFEQYEENETVETIAITVIFVCENGFNEHLVIFIHVDDTNNNSPLFLPSNEFTYTVPTPLPPGIKITGCFDGITVRDIDLTTEKINFTIEDNPFFEIAYDAASSTKDKEFIAILTSKTFIRNLFEPITLNVSATDIDRTNDPPLTAFATVTFKGDTSFELPEDPVFAQAFYSANYTKEHQVILPEPISLQSGFHELVRFDLQGELSDKFELDSTNLNQLTIRNVLPLETDILRENQIFLVVRADREHTSGDTATVIVHLPEGVSLEFEQSKYRGTIKNNTLEELVLLLTQGYEGEVVNTQALGEYSQYFATNILGNEISLTTNEIPDSVINENNIISLEVVASTEFSWASTIVILEIVKDDNETPVFSSPLYTGSYATESGLTMEQIMFNQGYNGTIELSLSGDYSNYFVTTREEAVVTINNITSIPPSIFKEQQIFLTLQATKPLTVGASAVIVITLPTAVQLEFENSSYRGIIENSISQDIALLLTQGYEGETVNTQVLGEYSQYFATSILGNTITLTMNQIPDSVINENNIISLEVVASTEFSSASTIVILEIVKDDNVTPVFSSPLYTGSYATESGLTLEQIILIQGYNGTIELSLSGDHANYFVTTREDAVVTINNITSIPSSIFNQQRIVLTLQAAKPGTVGASAAIVITLPAVVPLEFENSTYRGTIENSKLQEFVLSLTQGYEGDVVNTQIVGEYSQYFGTSILGSTITLTMNEIPDSVINENNIISLKVVASTEFSSASTIVILEIVKDDNVTPLFSSPLYTGSYDTENGLTLETITFTQGYNEIMELLLSGDYTNYFVTTWDGAVVTISNTTSIPTSIFNQQQIFLTLHATKHLTVGASAVIVITLPTGALLSFEQSHYHGSIVSSTLQELVLTLTQGYEADDLSIEVLGEYSQYFSTSLLGNSIKLLMDELPDNIIYENSIISLEVVASAEFSSASTIVILEIVKDEIVTPVFSSPLYTGSYATESGLALEEIIFTQGYNGTIELTLSGDHSNYFVTTREGAVVMINNITSIPPSIFNQEYILLTLQATKPGTVGASAAIIITLPAVSEVSLAFEQSHYHGSVVNNVLQELVLSLTQDYEGEDLNVQILGEYSQYFGTSTLGHSIELIMNQIPDSVIEENNIIFLEIVASTEFSSASTIVILEIVKDEIVTPVFSSPLYTGSYATESGLALEEIIFIQGYNGTIELTLSGVHSNYFVTTREGAVVTVNTTTSIPPSIFNQERILLTLQATKPGTVGASTAIVITLPAVSGSSLAFEQSHYHGSIVNNALEKLVLSLIQNIEGEVLNAQILGEYSQYFGTSIVGNSIELIMNEMPDSVINESTIISLEIVVSTEFSWASTIVILEIIKDDNVTPVFSSPLYTGSYATESGLTMEQIIFSQGYNGTIELSLSGDHSNYFITTQEGAVVTLNNITSIPPSIFNQQRILLTLQATKPGTVGASAAIVITLPAVSEVSLAFEQSHYHGSVVNNVLQELVLSLTQDYEGEDLNVQILGEYSQYFGTSILGNSIELIMNQIPDSVIEENNIIFLQVVASTELSSASTIVILEIVKDEIETPVFSSPLYTGSYATESGLSLEEIIFTQGYNGTIELTLSGVHSNYFVTTREGAVVTVNTTTSIPPSIFNQERILLTLQATKPGTVGASTAIVITLPAVSGSSLAFEQSHYHGSIVNNALEELVLSLVQNIEGEVLNAQILGEFSQYFSTSILGNSIELIMNEMPDSAISDNTIISLEVVVSTEFSWASTIVILEIVKDDNVTPVFSSPLYTGSYATESGLTMQQIIFTQGYNGTIELSLSGDHSNYFATTQEGAVVTINNITSIPPSIFNQQHILLTLQATKPGTVGASAAIVITLPEEFFNDNTRLVPEVSLAFEQSHYHGSVVNNVLQELVLSLTQDYEGEGLNVQILGEYSQYFGTSILGNSIELIMNPIPDSVIEENNIIFLQVVATTEFSSASTIVILEIVKDDIVIPVFSSPLYTGSYATESGLTLEEITFTQGYNGTIDLTLSGVHSSYFVTTREGAVVTVNTTTSIPPSIFNQQRILLTLQATKPGTVGASTAIVITLPAVSESSLAFEQSHYHGSIVNNALEELVLSLIQNIEGVVLNAQILGEFSQYFNMSIIGNSIELIMNDVPDSVISENTIISLEVVVSSELSWASTIVILEIVKDDNVTPVFSSPLYTGSYATESGLTMEQIIFSQGYNGTIELSLSGVHSNYFETSREGAVVTINNITNIPPSIFNQEYILLTLQATKPGTVGASAAIIITLPAVSGASLAFEQSHYHGSIVNNILQELVLSLTPVYEGQVLNAQILGEYSQYFSTNILGNSIELIMNQLPDSVINEYNIITLEVVASTELSSASTIVILEIVKDEIETPIFSSPLYTGSYATESGLTHEQIIFTQGYNGTIELSLSGDHSNYFVTTQQGAVVTINNITSIPPSIFNQQRILLTLQATKPGTVGASTAIVITLPAGASLAFEQSHYHGSIIDNTLQVLVLSLTQIYEEEDLNTQIIGEYSQYFSTFILGNSIELMMNQIPDSVINENNIIPLEVVAFTEFSSASTIVILEIVKDDNETPVFSSPLYTGSYATESGLALEEIIFTQGYNGSIELSLSGVHSSSFVTTREGAVVTINNTTSIPPSIFIQQRILLTLQATKPGTVGASAAIIITLPAVSEPSLTFEQSHYHGSIMNNTLQDLVLSLTQVFVEGVLNAQILGEYSQYFSTSILGNSIELIMNQLPDYVINENNIISLKVVATTEFSSASTIVILEIVKDEIVTPVFSSPLYTGSYATESGLILEQIILSQGYNGDVELSLSGDHSIYFETTRDGAVVTINNITSIPPSIFNQERILLTLQATKPGTVGASAAIIITLPAGTLLEFEESNYMGTIKNNTLEELVLLLTQGYEGEVIETQVLGEYSHYFTTSILGNSITLVMNQIPDSIINENTIISLEVVAFTEFSSASTIVILEIVKDDIVTPVFSSPLYTGSYATESGLTLEQIIFIQGYDDTIELSLFGDHSIYFETTREGAYVTISNITSIPTSIFNQQFILLTLEATKPGTMGASTAIVITLPSDVQTGNDVSFEKLVYEGIIQLTGVEHESIIISNYKEVDVVLHGEYSSLFFASVMDGVVTIQTADNFNLPNTVTRVVLELHAGDARAVLLLTVTQSDVPVLPTVTFSSASYVLSVEAEQTGVIGRVLATADNGEAVTYSLNVDDAHLLARVSVNELGELHLSAPANSGLYTFQLIATSVITKATGTAMAHLTVQAVTIIDDNKIFVPPLIILNRKEEEPHDSLVPLNSSHVGCQYTLNNRWPPNQSWLYVDENGLHTKSIDREHESIAFMALSQVQVELILTCETDNIIRTKRSQRSDSLGPYDYGANRWILTESIPYNSRRTLVNLIVDDINDNYPIFIGKENEPIAIGYPVDELEERILPRSLAELQATDADVGENAALMYWSSEEALAVSPTTGFVHVRTGAKLQNDQSLIVNVTDQNGEGLTGNIALVVKLLNVENIVVVTIQNAFLDDEKSVITQLSKAVGYELKILRSVVTSNAPNQNMFSKTIRNTSASGISLLLYVYGLIDREPVDVVRLTEDINNNAAAASVINTVSLEDHLLPIETTVIESDTAFFVATIVLSVLIFIIIIIAAIWFLLRWRKSTNYNKFSDNNSSASGIDSVDQLSKPETPKARLNIEELKRSEKRLQDRLNAPIEEVTVESIPTKKEIPIEAIADLLSPESNTPIVIQSVDKLKDADETDDDEFGEKIGPRRKSVVTFNENVEKIIHVQDDIDTISSTSSYEIFRL